MQSFVGKCGFLCAMHGDKASIPEWRNPDAPGIRSDASPPPALRLHFRPRMKVLVLGSGGREHALVWKLAQSPSVSRLWCAPGNAGTALERTRANTPVVNVDIASDNLVGLLEFARREKPDLTVVGPDNPLALGVVDRFQEAGFTIWGPNQRAAQFESSKAFSQDFMERHGVPTARAGTFGDAGAAKAFCRELGGRCAVKADGLALGKGVLLCHDVPAAEAAVDEILVQKAFGAAGSRIVVQELLVGMEVSLHALCDGSHALLFPTAQDHKRALDNDQGLNTGGMGTYSPTPFLSDEQLEAVGKAILDPWLAGCAKEGIDFRGLLYPGVMLTPSGPRVLEFNARFGDPETQVYLARLEDDLADLLMASAQGRLAGRRLHWKAGAAVCVVMASAGYPGPSPKGLPIHGLDEAGRLPGVKVFHAGTTLRDGHVVTNGGRVLGVTATGVDVADARAKAYAAVAAIRFDGAQWRSDIGSKALNQG
jgi:phosphoribosylamine--glycine ligase